MTNLVSLHVAFCYELFSAEFTSESFVLLMNFDMCFQIGKLLKFFATVVWTSVSLGSQVKLHVFF